MVPEGDDLCRCMVKRRLLWQGASVGGTDDDSEGVSTDVKLHSQGKGQGEATGTSWRGGGVLSGSPVPPPPVSNECLVQRTLPFGPCFWDPINWVPGLGPEFIGYRTACPANTPVRTVVFEDFIVRWARRGGGGGDPRVWNLRRRICTSVCARSCAVLNARANLRTIAVLWPSNAYVQATLGVGCVNFRTMCFGGTLLSWCKCVPCALCGKCHDVYVLCQGGLVRRGGICSTFCPSVFRVPHPPFHVECKRHPCPSNAGASGLAISGDLPLLQRWG